MLRFSIPFLLVLAWSGSAFAQSEINDAARQHFQAGVALLQDPDGARYEEAYSQFRAAYAASPSWKILGNLGICAMKLERDGEAIDALQKYLAEGGAEVGSEREQFERDLQTLQVNSGGVALHGLAAGDVVIDRRIPLSGAPIANRYEVQSSSLVTRVRAGRHEIVVQRAGFAEARHEFEAVPGGNVEHTFEFSKNEAQAATPATASSGEPPTSDSGGSSGRKIAAYSALGVGAVGTALGVVFALQHGSKSSDADERYDACLDRGGCDGSDAADIRTLDDDAASAGTLSVIGFAVGAAGIGTGLVLLLTGGEDKTATHERRVTPFVSIGRVGLSGIF